MANCPACKNTSLIPAQFEGSLPVLTCSSCGGSWIRANEYALWLKSQKAGSFDESRVKEASQHFPVTETNKATTCPDCGHLLRKYRIGAQVDFHLERCNNCNGVWLDKNEWESLKAADLHDEINKIFTKPWQQHVEDATAAGKLEALYLKKFGESDYQKIRETRAWLLNNPNRSALIAFLLDKDPFSI